MNASFLSMRDVEVKRYVIYISHIVALADHIFGFSVAFEEPDSVLARAVRGTTSRRHSVKHRVE